MTSGTGTGSTTTTFATLIFVLCVAACFVGGEGSATAAIEETKWAYLSAPWTPFTQDKKLDTTKVPLAAKFHKESGITHVWAVGGMGQWSTLTIGERMELAQAWVQEGHKNDLYIMVHTFSPALEDTITLSKHAQQIGADAIALLPPSWPEKVASLQDLVQWMSIVSDSVDLPLYYYHLPGSTGVNFKMSELLNMSREALPKLAGIKYVEDNLEDFAKCLEMRRQDGTPYLMFWAPEPKLQSLPIGAVGFVLAEAYINPYLMDVIIAWERNDTQAAQKASDRIVDLRSIIGQTYGKDVMKMIGIDLGPPRLPRQPVPASINEKVQKELRDWGFLPYVEYAQCKLIPNSKYPSMQGSVTFRTTEYGVTVDVSVNGVPEGKQQLAVLIHRNGDLSNEQSIGEIYIGDGSENHGCPNNTDRREGDMGNWDVNGGVMHASKELDLLAMSGAFSIVGRSVVIHENADDCSDIASVGGVMASCVIGIGNPAELNVTIPNAHGKAIVNGASQQNNETNAMCEAVCILEPTEGNTIAGVVTLEVGENGGTTVTARIAGLEKGSIHGFHIHQFGDISATDGTAAAGHYNPFVKEHALPLTADRHVGDMGNIKFYDTEGNAWYRFDNDLIHLCGPDNVIGRSIIVHAKADDGCAQPTGDAGPRIAQCVIGLAEDPIVPEVPTQCCGEQDASDCTPHPPDSHPKSHAWIIFLVVSGTVLVGVAACVIAVIVIKRKKKSYEYEHF